MTDLSQTSLITSTPANFNKGKSYGKATSFCFNSFQQSTRSSRSIFSNRIKVFHS
jgi:hypothetical protein